MSALKKTSFKNSFNIFVKCILNSKDPVLNTDVHIDPYGHDTPSDNEIPVSDDDLQKYQNTRPTVFTEESLIIDQCHIDVDVKSMKDVENLEIECQTLYLSKDELITYENPKYHSRFFEICDNVYQVNLCSVKFCDQEITLDDNFIDLLENKDNLLNNHLDIQFQTSMLQVIIEKDYFMMCSSNPLNKISDLLHKYFVNFSVCTKYNVQLDLYGNTLRADNNLIYEGSTCDFKYNGSHRIHLNSAPYDSTNNIVRNIICKII